MTVGEVNTRVIELAELHERDTQDLYALLEDAEDGRTGDSIDYGGGGLCFLRGLGSLDRIESGDPSGASDPTLIMLYAIETIYRHIRHNYNCRVLSFRHITRDMLNAAELLAHREQQRRARQLGPDARILDHQNASGDANILKKKITDKYCPQGEIKKLEIELWNLKVKGNDVPTYTERFQELTLICTKFFANETEKVDKYISGLPDNIYGNVKSARPKMLDETIELANDLMD
ncbi:putative reverse transcriptase domain-containing protein [Tanacetum coccineum]